MKVAHKNPLKFTAQTNPYCDVCFNNFGGLFNKKHLLCFGIRSFFSILNGRCLHHNITFDTSSTTFMNICMCPVKQGWLDLVHYDQPAFTSHPVLYDIVKCCMHTISSHALQTQRFRNKDRLCIGVVHQLCLSDDIIIRIYELPIFIPFTCVLMIRKHRGCSIGWCRKSIYQHLMLQRCSSCDKSSCIHNP